MESEEYVVACSSAECRFESRIWMPGPLFDLLEDAKCPDCEELGVFSPIRVVRNLDGSFKRP